ncbi:hypothetical protein [Hyphococcus lacteus]|uniref:Lipoprotein n=1 Tax=Hyphococcus lacteus TaxID=3143536 RepID=A0ABV3Z389_9PROT
MKKIYIGPIIGITSAVFLAACGGDDSANTKEKNIEDAAKAHGIDLDATVDAKGDTEKLEIKQGASRIGKNLDLPPDFPADVFISSDWNIMGTIPVPTGGYSIQSMSSDEADVIVKLVRERMIAEGWDEVSSDSPMPQMSRIGFEKDDRMASFNVMENGATRMVQMVTTTKP